MTVSRYSFVYGRLSKPCKFDNRSSYMLVDADHETFPTIILNLHFTGFRFVIDKTSRPQLGESTQLSLQDMDSEAEDIELDTEQCNISDKHPLFGEGWLKTTTV